MHLLVTKGAKQLILGLAKVFDRMKAYENSTLNYQTVLILFFPVRTQTSQGLTCTA